MRRLAHLVALVALSYSCSSGTAHSQPRAPRLGANSIARLVLDKSEHRLDAYAGSRVVAHYRVAIGGGGLGPKRREGDDRTPEGTYRIDSRHHSSAFHRFLHVSYPNADDRAAYARLRAEGGIPRDVGIGGDIGIHGLGDGNGPALGQALGVDWTAGCIAVSNAESEELFRAVRPNAVLVIEP